MNEDFIWLLKMIGFLAAGVIISQEAHFNIQTNQTENTATIYQPQTYEQVIILR